MNMDHCPGLIESLCSTAWVIQPELSPVMSETASVPPQEGWGKQLNYVMAFHRMGVVDVTRRYSKQDLSSRRTQIPETQLHTACRQLTERLRRYACHCAPAPAKGAARHMPQLRPNKARLLAEPQSQRCCSAVPD